MNLYICFLRAVNIASKNKINMKSLVIELEKIDLTNIRYYVHTGNIVFNSKLTKNDLTNKIYATIKSTYDHDITVIVKTADETQSILLNNPFLSEPKIDLSKLHITLLEDQPNPELVAGIGDKRGGDDLWKLRNDVIYVYVENGYGRSKITNNFFESKLKVKATSRSWLSFLSTVKLLDQ